MGFRVWGLGFRVVMGLRIVSYLDTSTSLATVRAVAPPPTVVVLAVAVVVELVQY